jgi:hypothetical protein
MILSFNAMGMALMNRSGGGGSSATQRRRFVSFYGASSRVCHQLWHLLLKAQIMAEFPALKQEHLLWALFFLKVYGTENVQASIVAVDEKTYRKWIWIVIEWMSNLDVVSYFRKKNLLFASCFYSPLLFSFPLFLFSSSDLLGG